jgi:hypothetical protein
MQAEVGAENTKTREEYITNEPMTEARGDTQQGQNDRRFTQHISQH